MPAASIAMFCFGCTVCLSGIALIASQVCLDMCSDMCLGIASRACLGMCSGMCLGMCSEIARAGAFRHVSTVDGFCFNPRLLYGFHNYRSEI